MSLPLFPYRVLYLINTCTVAAIDSYYITLDIYPEESTTMTQRYRDEGRTPGTGTTTATLVSREYRKANEASMEDLETWAENVLDAQTLDDVFDLGH